MVSMDLNFVYRQGRSPLALEVLPGDQADKREIQTKH